MADIEGFFTVPRLPAGTYTVNISFIGYLAEARTVTLMDGETRTLDISLVRTEVEVNPLTVTASRRQEKRLDAPASITVIEARELETRTALTAAEHLKSAPAVDLITTGLNQSRVVIRGFNDNLSSTLLTLIDNRITQTPSVRLNALQLVPISSGDIEQIEVVAGPASALYGPNSANGVVHFITRSPFESRGTTLSLAGGERDVFIGAFRHAGLLHSKVAYKLSAQYYTGTDFEFRDPIEVTARQQALASGAAVDTLRIGDRDFNIENLALDGRVDFQFNPDLKLILNSGLTRGENIEITPTGSVQVNGARIGYFQGRLLYKNLFVQSYANLLNAGDSYFLRTGETFKNTSRLFVTQVQSFLDWGSRQRFTYGADVLLTRPESGGTVNGLFEDRDDINELGVYLQSETTLSSRWSILAAGRLDHHNLIEDLTVSPRAALVFKPRSTQTLRLTYNRAFNTPRGTDYFTDVLGRSDVFQAAIFEGLLGFPPTTDLRVQGMADGFQFRRSTNGLPQFRTPYAPLDPRGLTRNDYIELHDPVAVNTMWGVAREAAVRGFIQGLADNGLFSDDQVAAASAALDAILPTEVEGVRHALRNLDLDSQDFVSVDELRDFEPLKITRTETFELGYKGILFNKISVGLDVYYTRIKNFIGPLQVGTPNVFLDISTLRAAIASHATDVLSDPGNAALNEALLPIDRIPLFGNRDGSVVSEVATLVSSQLAGIIPFGTVSPESAFDPTAVILMRRNFGNLSLYGLDLSATYYLNRQWQIGGTYAYVSDNFFEKVGGVDDVALNAPRHKAGLLGQYHDSVFDALLRFRFVGPFPVKSDVYIGEVDHYLVLDLSAGYRLPFLDRTRLSLTIQNVTNNKHREFVDVPEIGRLAILRVTHEL